MSEDNSLPPTFYTKHKEEWDKLKQELKITHPYMSELDLAYKIAFMIKFRLIDEEIKNETE